MKVRLDEAVEGYLFHLKSKGLAANTIATQRSCFNRFLRVLPNIYVENVEPHHMDHYFMEAAQKRSTNSLRIDTCVMSRFVTWCQETKKMPRANNPMVGRDVPKRRPREWRGVELTKFPALLDAAKTPRDRMLIAEGIYLLGRSAELTTLRIEDVSLDMRRIRYRVPKTHKVDLMPICRELDRELRDWFTWYSQTCGPLQPHWYLVPAMTGVRFIGRNQLTPSVPNPEGCIGRPAAVAQYCLEAIGYATRNPDGTSRFEGMHTLRRSGARGLYEEQRSRGHDNAIGVVQQVLHHSSKGQTEEYIGALPDQLLRNEMLTGEWMYPSLADPKVVTLGDGQSEDDHGASEHDARGNDDRQMQLV